MIDIEWGKSTERDSVILYPRHFSATDVARLAY